jgi:hypothetical protein
VIIHRECHSLLHSCGCQQGASWRRSGTAGQSSSG